MKAEVLLGSRLSSVNYLIHAC